MPIEPSREDHRKEENFRDQTPPRSREKAYWLTKPIDKLGTTEKILEELWKTRTNTEFGDLVRASPGIAEALRRALTKKRKKPLRFEDSFLQESCFPYMEDNFYVELEHDALEINELPEVTAVYISTMEDQRFYPELELEKVIVPDPVQIYLSSLGENEVAKQVYIADDSASLRAIWPKVNGLEFVEAVVDSGSQIVSMALSQAEKLDLKWDPDVQIHMQGATGQLKRYMLSTSQLTRFSSDDHLIF
ncbi:hypothetical protein K438DRAFT_1952730 [Mycena galopus ATCC 62051]|nr:hypothetical protein K438DRAFT_1952730 [Mycena galopus ATCC 62051]